MAMAGTRLTSTFQLSVPSCTLGISAHRLGNCYRSVPHCRRPCLAITQFYFTGEDDLLLLSVSTTVLKMRNTHMQKLACACVHAQHVYMGANTYAPRWV